MNPTHHQSLCVPRLPVACTHHPGHRPCHSPASCTHARHSTMSGLLHAWPHVPGVRTLLVSPSAPQHARHSPLCSSSWLFPPPPAHADASASTHPWAIQQAHAGVMGSRGQPVGSGKAHAQEFRDASVSGDVEAMGRLLGAAAAEAERSTLMATDWMERTAVMHAASYGHVEAIPLLLDHPSADPAERGAGGDVNVGLGPAVEGDVWQRPAGRRPRRVHPPSGAWCVRGSRSSSL
jgi:hypothetical protein